MTSVGNRNLKTRVHYTVSNLGPDFQQLTSLLLKIIILLVFLLVFLHYSWRLALIFFLQQELLQWYIHCMITMSKVMSHIDNNTSKLPTGVYNHLFGNRTSCHGYQRILVVYNRIRYCNYRSIWSDRRSRGEGDIEHWGECYV